MSANSVIECIERDFGVPENWHNQRIRSLEDAQVDWENREYRHASDFLDVFKTHPLIIQDAKSIVSNEMIRDLKNFAISSEYLTIEFINRVESRLHCFKKEINSEWERFIWMEKECEEQDDAMAAYFVDSSELTKCGCESLVSVSAHDDGNDEMKAVKLPVTHEMSLKIKLASYFVLSKMLSELKMHKRNGLPIANKKGESDV